MGRSAALVLVLGLTGCGQEYAFSPIEAEQAVPGGEGAQVEQQEPQSWVRSPRGSRGEVAEPVARPTNRPRAKPWKPEAPVQTVQLGGDATTDTVDFLFVVDNSSSMKHIVDQVFAGLDALTAEGVFPSDARIGVMSTLPSNPAHARRPHSAAPAESFLAFEPGFGDLVDAPRIEAFRAVAPPELAERFSIDGCDAWFSPDATNPRGVPCLVAHTQEILFPLGVEAGLTAVGQRMARGPLFRTGAAVNVIFVSDTHDPGVKGTSKHFPGLVALRPTGEELAVTASRHQVTSSFRLHAIAPATECSEEQWVESIGTSYFDAVDATGGKKLDVCTANPEDYVELVRAIVEEGSVPTRPVVPLRLDQKVGSVLVDGVPTSFHVSLDRKAVILDQPMPTSSAEVTIRYKAQSALRGGPTGVTPAAHGRRSR